MSADLSVLTESECRYLLAAGDVGRVVISLAALPVSYRLIDDAVVFRTAPGAKLMAALDNTVVGFEIDRVDIAAHSGWSVLVVGTSRVITDTTEIAELEQADIPRWRPGPLPYYVAISTHRISGRRLTTALP